MKNSSKKIIRALTFATLCLGLLTLNTGCKLVKLWQGDEQVTVVYGDKTATVSLKGMVAITRDGVAGVKLSNILTRANLTTNAQLQNSYFNFIDSDGLDMSYGLTSDMSLPGWSDTQKAYLYDSGSDSGLNIQWAAGTTPGDDSGNYFKVKLMNGGTIQILESNVAAPSNPWKGSETVVVEYGAATATVKLSDLNISTYNGTNGVRLSDIIKKANLASVDKLKNFYFNFIATDGFDMSLKAKNSQMKLPVWTDMQKGYLYDSGSSSGLCVKWESSTAPGAFGKFYNAKLMNGGKIQILESWPY